MIIVVSIIIFVLLKPNKSVVENDYKITELPKVDPTDPTDPVPVIAGTFKHSILSDGLTRTYILHVPPQDNAKSIPLVVLLHGGGGNGVRIIDQTKFDTKADINEFILVAPDGIENNWNDGRGSTFRRESTDTVANVDDVKFIADLIKEIQKTYPIDKDRIYITGFSNGAMMAQRMICDLPNIFAAVGETSGPMLTQTANTCIGASAVIGIHGTNDPFFPISGDGDGIPIFPRILARNAEQQVLTMSELTELWLTKNRCQTTANITKSEPSVNDGTEVNHYVYAGCNKGYEVEYYIVNKMGHSWPPYLGESKLSGLTSANINATDVIWDFFSKHTLTKK